MSILSGRADSSNLNRRAFMTMTATSTLAMPALKTTSNDDGQCKRLDPDDPVAVELDQLWQRLRSAHEPDFEAHLAYESELDRLHSIEDSDERHAAFDQHESDLEAMNDRRRETEQVRRNAYFDLLLGVVEADGRDDPTEATWRRYGTPLASVLVGRRLYTVCADSDSEFDGLRQGDPWGMAEVCVIDL